MKIDTSVRLTTPYPLPYPLKNCSPTGIIARVGNELQARYREVLDLDVEAVLLDDGPPPRFECSQKEGGGEYQILIVAYRTGFFMKGIRESGELEEQLAHYRRWLTAYGHWKECLPCRCQYTIEAAKVRGAMLPTFRTPLSI